MDPSPIRAIATQRCGDRGPGVACTEVVVGRFLAPQELRDAALGADAGEAVAASGEQLVGVALVTDVEDEPVARRVEHVVQRGDELHGAEARGQVAARARDALDDRLTQLAGHLRDLLPGQRAQVCRRCDAVQQTLAAHSRLRTA
jgi:hypothetical protein